MLNSFARSKLTNTSPYNRFLRASNPAYHHPPVLFSSRTHSFVRWLNIHQDHLNAQGYIKDKLVQERLEFLGAHGMLEDPYYLERRVIFRNLHLFDAYAKMNREKMARGLAPMSHDGHLMVLHHLDQTHESIWVVLSDDFHRKNDRQLHSQVATATPVQRKEFAKERRRYWQDVDNSLSTITKRLRLD